MDQNFSRRSFLALSGAAALLPFSALGALAQGAPLKIGTIGAGNIGGTLGSFWVKAGHEVFFSSLNPDELKQMVADLGPRAHAGATAQAIAFGDVILLAVPYRAIPQVGRDFAAALKGKIIIDTCNATPARDGEELVALTKQKSIGVATASFFPGARMVRGFNSIGAKVLQENAGRTGDKLPIPIASDDREAAAIAARLVRDAGFEPVMSGPLAKSAEFSMGTSGYGVHANAAALKKVLGVAE
jgi:predicted dinucleotide-binding enzyme